MKLAVEITRDCDTWRLRKVLIEVINTEKDEVVDSCRMFAGLRFAQRLARKVKRAKRRAAIMVQASMDPLP